MTKPLVFISHIHEDRRIATALEATIVEALLGGVDVFNAFDRESLVIGDPWREVIIDRLKSCRALLVIATPESVASPWVNFESGGAWLAGNRVIPCCVKGMTPASLPAPLRDLQAINLAAPDDLKNLIEYLASLAGLNSPPAFDYAKALSTIEESWLASIAKRSNEDFVEWIGKTVVRPRRHLGETKSGIVRLKRLEDVSPYDASQLSKEGLVAGDSVRCWLEPVGFDRTLYYCFANNTIADLMSDAPQDAELMVTLKCLGQIKIYESDFVLMDEDRGISYPPAFLIQDTTIRA